MKIFIESQGQSWTQLKAKFQFPKANTGALNWVNIFSFHCLTCQMVWCRSSMRGGLDVETSLWRLANLSTPAEWECNVPLRLLQRPGPCEIWSFKGCQIPMRFKMHRWFVLGEKRRHVWRLEAQTNRLLSEHRFQAYFFPWVYSKHQQSDSQQILVWHTNDFYLLSSGRGKTILSSNHLTSITHMAQESDCRWCSFWCPPRRP